MKTIGTKALLRALAIFLSILLVKFGIDMIPQADSIVLKILYTIGIGIVILLLIIVPSFLPTKRDDASKDRKTEK